MPHQPYKHMLNQSTVTTQMCSRQTTVCSAIKKLNVNNVFGDQRDVHIPITKMAMCRRWIYVDGYMFIPSKCMLRMCFPCSSFQSAQWFVGRGVEAATVLDYYTCMLRMHFSSESHKASSSSTSSQEVNKIALLIDYLLIIITY